MVDYVINVLVYYVIDVLVDYVINVLVENWAAGAAKALHGPHTVLRHDEQCLTLRNARFGPVLDAGPPQDLHSPYTVLRHRALR